MKILDLFNSLLSDPGSPVPWPDGTKRWYRNGQAHRDGGPAIERSSDGYKAWYRHDKQHRKGGPAVEYASGHKEWWLNDKLHREDGPAVEIPNVVKIWYIKGNRHREDGPAVECADGSKEWFRNGERHRDDGPAIERANGKNEWWRNGKQLNALEIAGLQQEIENKAVPVHKTRSVVVFRYGADQPKPNLSRARTLSESRERKPHMLFKIEPPQDGSEAGLRLVTPLSIEGAMGGQVVLLYKADASEKYETARIDLRFDYLVAAIEDAAIESQPIIDLTPEGAQALRERYEPSGESVSPRRGFPSGPKNG